MKENKLDLVHTYMQREIAAMQLIESQINDVQYCSVIDKIMHLTGRLVFMGVGNLLPHLQVWERPLFLFMPQRQCTVTWV